MEICSEPFCLPDRPADGHKGTFGRVLIVAGSRGMSGAAQLCGISALRGGAGLVFLAVPSSVQSIVAGYEPSYLTIGLTENVDDGQLDGPAVEQLLHLCRDKDAIAIGPGLGTGPNVEAAVTQLLAASSQPMVVDADALNVLAKRMPSHGARFSLGPGPRILTPHPGEFSRLSGLSMGEISANRRDVAMQFARDNGVVLLLKGQQTIITDGDRVAINPTGNSGMATGGSGDVLTGLIAALLGQRLSAFDAARTGAFLHGLAGDLAAEELSQPGLIASDLPRYLTRAWKQVLR